MAPWLALQWLRLRLAVLAVLSLLHLPTPPLLAPLVGNEGVVGSSSATGRAAGIAAGPLARLVAWLRRLPQAAEWDTLLLTLMVGLLCYVVWLKRRRNAAAAAATATSLAQQRGVAAPAERAAAEVARQAQPQEQQQAGTEDGEREAVVTLATGGSSRTEPAAGGSSQGEGLRQRPPGSGQQDGPRAHL